MPYSSASDTEIRMPCALVDKGHFLNKNNSKFIKMGPFMSYLAQKSRFSSIYGMTSPFFLLHFGTFVVCPQNGGGNRGVHR